MLDANTLAESMLIEYYPLAHEPHASSWMKFMGLGWAAQSAVNSMKKPTQPTREHIVSGQFHEETDAADARAHS